jgi:hypothetical protein
MPNYANSKIYKITSGDKTYIGSTTAPTLAKRLAQHVGNYKGWKEGKGWYSSFQLIDTGDYQITLIELCPCNSKDELTARERFWIENTVCVNKNRPGRTEQEWREANRDKIAAQKKTYRDANKEAIAEKKKTYREANKDRIAEYNKTYYEANKERILN